MSTKKILTLVAILVLAAGIWACSFGPPESCGENIGGTANIEMFSQYFTNMAFVNQAGEAGLAGENGMVYTSADKLELRADSLSDVDVRVCIQNFTNGNIAIDQAQTFPQGAGGISLGSFGPGIFVVRVIVDGALVKNFPFEVK